MRLLAPDFHFKMFGTGDAGGTKRSTWPVRSRLQPVARAVRFLLQPDSYITGQVLTVDGGLTL